MAELEVLLFFQISAMGHFAALFYVVYNLILTLRLFDDVGNCNLTHADAMEINDLHARIFTSKILAPNIIAPEFIIKHKESCIISAQKSLHQKAEAPTIDALTLEKDLTSYQKSLRQKLSLQQKLNYDEYNEKENVIIPQLAAVFVAPNFGVEDQSPSLDALTGLQFVGSLLLPTLSVPAPRGIPDGNIALGGGSGGAVVIRGGSVSLHLNVFGRSHRLNLFQIMLCVMLIDNDCYAYYLKFINWNSEIYKLLRLLYIFILCTLTFFFISIICSVSTYFITDKILS
eukprot:UN02325